MKRIRKVERERESKERNTRKEEMRIITYERRRKIENEKKKKDREEERKE